MSVAIQFWQSWLEGMMPAVRPHNALTLFALVVVTAVAASGRSLHSGLDDSETRLQNPIQELLNQ